MLNVQSKSHATQSTQSTLQLAVLVDEFATLHQEVTSLKPKLERYEKLKKQLASEASHFGNQEVRLQGTAGYVVFTRPAVKRALTNVSAFLNIVGMVAFLKCVTISVTKADKLLSESDKAILFKESTGSRRLKDSGTYADMIGAALSETQIRH